MSNPEHLHCHPAVIGEAQVIVCGDLHWNQENRAALASSVSALEKALYAKDVRRGPAATAIATGRYLWGQYRIRQMNERIRGAR